MLTVFDINTPTLSLPDKPIYVDANVLFWTFYPRIGLIPTPPNAYQTASYPSYLQDLLSHSCDIRVFTSTLSELINVVEKTEMEIYKHSRRLEIMSRKNYRLLRAERKALFDTLSLIIRQIQSSFKIVEDTVITSNSVLEFIARHEDHKMDHFDYILAEYCNSKQCSILTDDKDFICKHPACDVYSANSSLINTARSCGYNVGTC